MRLLRFFVAAFLGRTSQTCSRTPIDLHWHRPNIRAMSNPSPSIGQILGHYRILEQIGAGGMGVVYRAHDEQRERDVSPSKSCLPVRWPTRPRASNSAKKRW